MKKEPTYKHNFESALKGRTDHTYQAGLTDEEVARSIDGDSDWAELETLNWSESRLIIPEPKKPISIRIEPDILSFFKEQGPGYQKRIQAVLRSYVDQMRARKAG